MSTNFLRHSCKLQYFPILTETCLIEGQTLSTNHQISTDTNYNDIDLSKYVLDHNLLAFLEFGFECNLIIKSKLYKLRFILHLYTLFQPYHA